MHRESDRDVNIEIREIAYGHVWDLRAYSNESVGSLFINVAYWKWIDLSDLIHSGFDSSCSRAFHLDRKCQVRACFCVSCSPIHRSRSPSASAWMYTNRNICDLTPTIDVYRHRNPMHRGQPLRSFSYSPLGARALRVYILLTVLGSYINTRTRMCTYTEKSLRARWSFTCRVFVCLFRVYGHANARFSRIIRWIQQRRAYEFRVCVFSVFTRDNMEKCLWNLFTSQFE